MEFKINYYLRKILKSDVLESIAQSTSNFEYITSEHIVELEGVSVKRAEKRLDAAVKDGFLKKRYLYTDMKLKLNILVGKDQIGKKIPFPGAIDDATIYISPLFIKEVYVAS